MNSYHVLELVGEGSFGRVHKGRKRFSAQVVALKFIPKVGRSEKELRSLKREIEIMRGLHHPNIVQMFDSFETDKEVVVVTEYAEGELFQILEDDGHFPENQVQEIACQLVSALYYLHSHRILHRDMKPQNILLGKCGVVKLCDFGFARSMSVSTLVLTSIKGTPLYMSPELVEEKPYDHTADLWSLGCILYELHTGVPPFYTNSIFQLVQLIVRDPVKWPANSMSPTCLDFLKGLLTKDPQKRLSWPDLLHHPFVADGVLVLPGDSVFSPLTVAPSPDLLALKHQQVKEKSAGSGKNRLLRKVMAQRDDKQKGRAGEGERAGEDPGSRKSSAGRPRPHNLTDTSTPREQEKVQEAAKMFLDLKKQASVTSKRRGQISRDYEQEFPSVEVGPRFVRSCSEDVQNPSPRGDEQTEDYWRRLALETEPDYHAVIPQLKNKLLAFKSQLSDGILEDAWQILHPLRVLSKLLLNSDPENSHHVGRELGLPYLLFDLTSVMVDKLDVIKEAWIEGVLSEVLTGLLTYWDRHGEWAQDEIRLEELMKPVLKILSKPASTPLAPVAAAVLSMFTHHGVTVDVDIGTLSDMLKNSSLDSEPQVLLPPGWGICDGLLSLLLHSVYEHGNGSPSSSPRQEIWCDLWRTVGTTLETPGNPYYFCSTTGLHSFLSAMLCVFTKDPALCLPLFSDGQSECIHALGLVLHRDRCSGGTPTGVQEEDLDNLLVLSCLLLCFPFSLDLSPRTRAKVLDLYDRCGVVTGLLQMIQTRPPALLELPLSLLSRLLLCDPGRFVPRLMTSPRARDFLCPAGGDARQPTTTAARGAHASSVPRTAGSLLGALLQNDVLWDSAADLLVLLAQVARGPPGAPPPGPRLRLDAPVLHRALAHPHQQVRASTCSLLGNLNPFAPGAPPALGPGVFREMTGGLRDPCTPVRRTACRAVGNWLGFVGDHIHEGGGWVEESARAAPLLLSLITDPDALTRLHSCAALGNLGAVYGGSTSGGPAPVEVDVFRLLLAAACTDPHGGVRRAAVATLSVYSQREALRRVLVSLDAYEKVLQASHTAPPQQCDYRQLLQHLK